MDDVAFCVVVCDRAIPVEDVSLHRLLAPEEFGCIVTDPYEPPDVGALLLQLFGAQWSLVGSYPVSILWEKGAGKAFGRWNSEGL